MPEFASSIELNGLGKRVDNVEIFKAVQERENTYLRKDVDSNEQCITSLFKAVASLNKMTYKIVGGVAVSVFLLNAITIIIAAKMFS